MFYFEAYDDKRNARFLERKNIAKHLKTFNMFTDEFIAQMTGLEVERVERLKPKELLSLEKLRGW